MFRAHNNFVHEIFERTVLTSASRRIVRRHADNRNAQAVYQELCTHAAFRKVTLSANKETVFQYYVATARLDHWHGMSYNFVQEHWLMHLQLLDTLTADKCRISSEGNDKLNFVLL